MTVEFEHQVRIDAPVEVVFDVSLDIDAHQAAMAASRERAVGGVTEGRIGLGQTVTWRATHFGIPFTMTSKITELERPHRFVDQQTKGPFHAFRHEHQFTPQQGGTLMVDRVCFTAPTGPIGRVVEFLVLKRYLGRLIEIRGAFIKEHAEHTRR